MEHRTAIIIIDKSALFRLGLESSLARGRFRILTSISGPSEIPDSLGATGEAVVLFGLGGEPQDLRVYIAQLNEWRSRFRVVVLAETPDREVMIHTVEAGGSGYLLKAETTPDYLRKSLELVLAGGVVLPQSFASLFGVSTPGQRDGKAARNEETTLAQPPLPAPVPPATRPDLPVLLSQREQIVLRQLTHGASNKHIARELGIAEATVKVHVKSLLRKIRVNNRTQAALWAIEHY